MRELTAKQKLLLRKWFKQSQPSARDKMLFGSMGKLGSVDDLSPEQWSILEDINDTEVLFQNVNRYLHDLKMGNVKLK